MSDPRVAITVSGTVPTDLDHEIASGRRPRADYRVMQHELGADIIDVSVALRRCGRFGAVLLRFVGIGPLLAWCIYRDRKRYDVVLTDGEQVGLPLALLLHLTGRKRVRHMMIVHVMSTTSKIWFARLGRARRTIDHYIVYCTPQADALTKELGVRPEHITVMPFMVDTAFFDDDRPADVDRRPKICSVGLERRDYPTLIRAVAGLDVDVVIAAASPWSTQSDSTETVELPSNVTVRRFDLFELRDLYRESQFVVMPLLDVDFQAGITTILEAMSMRRAVICTRTVGQIDTLVDGETGIYVPPGDADALRAAILELIADPALARRLGDSARGWVVANADVDVYASAVAAVVVSALT